ncbi:hypothetical protein [Tessaracoccus sp. MC1627]|uniref:hypothetical protein n=1 Tax=Tessaracoccus sp. MC1627 TaxID=2760312 RepID=UPI0021042A88|nr:hypothetical protein [Tessaracoccus sp. MC1627]
MDTSSKPATATIATNHELLTRTLPFGDSQDIDDAHRGFIAALKPGVVRATAAWCGTSIRTDSSRPRPR